MLISWGLVLWVKSRREKRTRITVPHEYPEPIDGQDTKKGWMVARSGGARHRGSPIYLLEAIGTGCKRGRPSSFMRRTWEARAATKLGLRLYFNPNSSAVRSTIGAILR